MTKEETISNLKAYLNGDTAIDNIIPLRSILKSVLKYLEPYLPSNLDESAEEYESSKDFHWYEQQSPFELTRNAFKAGAEWMAGQGVTLEGHVCKDEYATEAPFYYVETENSDDFLPLIGNKVVVQIRKK